MLLGSKEKPTRRETNLPPSATLISRARQVIICLEQSELYAMPEADHLRTRKDEEVSPVLHCKSNSLGCLLLHIFVRKSFVAIRLCKNWYWNSRILVFLVDIFRGKLVGLPTVN